MATFLAAGWQRQARTLYLIAAALFAVTITIGLLNGLDLIDFSPADMRPALLTHVHAGTVGWVSLGLVATAIWFFRSGDARLTLLLAVSTPIYVAAFYSGNFPARAITGVVILVAILWLVVWVWRQALAARSLPALAIALGLTTFTYGSIIGVLLQVQFATGQAIFPAGGDVIAAHASTMTFAYLLLVAMGLIEWRLKGTSGFPILGLIQIGAIFAGGLLLAGVLLLVDATTESGGQLVQAAGGIDLLLNSVSVVIFVVRIWPAALRGGWLTGGPDRYYRTAALIAPFAMALFMYLVYLFISLGDPTAIPAGILVALDHLVFVGVVTNLVVGHAIALAWDRRASLPWANQVVYWAIVVGLLVFAAGLVAEVPEIKRIGAPIMGVGTLLAVVVMSVRLWSSDLRGADAPG